MQRKCNEKELLNEIKGFVNVNHKDRIVDVSDEILASLNDDQMNCLLELKKYKYSLQYTIKS